MCTNSQKTKKTADWAGLRAIGGGHEIGFKAFPSLQMPKFPAHFSHSFPLIPVVYILYGHLYGQLIFDIYFNS